MTKITTADGNEIDFDAAVNLMDDDLREQLHTAVAGDATDAEFFQMYCVAHEKRFGASFVVN